MLFGAVAPEAAGLEAAAGVAGEAAIPAIAAETAAPAAGEAAAATAAKEPFISETSWLKTTAPGRAVMDIGRLGAEGAAYGAASAAGEKYFGTDPNAGSPPPICRLNAYGEFMLKDIPITISSYRVDLPSDVDYFTFGKKSFNPIYDRAMVPIVSTINITCYPMYSRNALANFSVENFLKAYATSTINSNQYL